MPRQIPSAVPTDLAAPQQPGDLPEVRTLDFGGLLIQWDHRILEPRPWTFEQASWLSELSENAPAGPALELCSGAGHLGLVLATHTGRSLVQVERDPVAAAYSRTNAERAGIETDLRIAPLVHALGPDERFALVLADPPWVPHDEIGRFPEDPVGAIDGGPQGLDLGRECLALAAHHLLPGGHAVLQLGSLAQVDELWIELESQTLELELMDVRERPGGALAHFRVR